MTIVIHLTEASHDVLPVHGEGVHLLRHRFADALADAGLDSVLAAIDDHHPNDRLVVVHPDIARPAVDHLSALLRRSQRRRSMIMIGHGLGPLGADLLVEQLATLLSDRSVSLQDAADWCQRSEARVTDVVWTRRANPRWAQLDLRGRLHARLPGRRVRAQLRPRRESFVAAKDEMLAGLAMTGADVVVSGHDASVVAQMVEQLGTADASSVRIVESGSGSPVAAEVVISSTLSPP